MNCPRPSTRLLFLLASMVWTGWTRPAAAFETVVIDPGHGGIDEGTSWYKVNEKDLTLGVARRLERILAEKKVQSVLTRHTDTYISLDERAEIGNRYPDSLFVSIHFNGSSGRGITGFQTYHFIASPSGHCVAQSIQEALGETVGGRSRGVFPNDFAVLARTVGTAVLVECGFISNKQDAAKFSSPEGQEALAQALASGIMRIKPMVDFDPPECEFAKCEIYEHKYQERERRLASSSRAGASSGGKKRASSRESISGSKKKPSS